MFLFICTQDTSLRYQILVASYVNGPPTTNSTRVRRLNNDNLLLLCAWMIQTQPLGTVLDSTITLELHITVYSCRKRQSHSSSLGVLKDFMIRSLIMYNIGSNIKTN